MQAQRDARRRKREAAEEAAAFATADEAEDAIDPSAGLVVDGLMTVGPTVGGPEAARAGFRTTRQLVDRLGLTTCSMGMTDDLEVAIGEGATRVRLGTALFGPRP